MNPFLATDGYKVGHHLMYPKDTQLVYSNFTPRSNKYAGENQGTRVVNFGHQIVVRVIKEMFEKDFFGRDKDEVCQEVKKEYSLFLNSEYDVAHIEALWDLGYLPLKVKALPEGVLSPIGVPVLTIVNTKEEFYWLTNFLETLISNILWKPMTSATTAYNYRKILMEYAEATNSVGKAFVDFQGHDFSMRGMDSIFATQTSGLGHATSFLGSDSLPVIHGARSWYDEKGFVVGGVNATEHSVMCAGTGFYIAKNGGDWKYYGEAEIEVFKQLLRDFPEGILSVVSDTWDLWKVLTEYLRDPEVKALVLGRNGTLVVRPDSGDPVDIVCGKKPKKRKYFYSYTKEQCEQYEINIEEMLANPQDYLQGEEDMLPSMSGGRDYTPDFNDGDTCNILLGDRAFSFEVYTGECIEATWCHTINETDIADFKELDPVEADSPEAKGVIELLWDEYGGTISDEGYKVLDSHIGAIYGDAITLERAKEICKRLMAKGFASTNIVLGVGSFTYQFNTRDNWGFAMKATYCEVKIPTYDDKGAVDGYEAAQIEIFKDPITDDGTKKSAKGLLQVYRDNDEYALKDQVTWEEEQEGELQTIFLDGELMNQVTLTEIRNRLKTKDNE